MAAILWAVVCEQSYKDEKGRPCIIGIFSRISAESFPCSHAGQLLVATSGAVNETAVITITVSKVTTDSPCAELVLPPALVGKQGWLSLDFSQVRYPSPGLYTIRVSVPKGRPYDLPLVVRQVQKGASQEEPERTH